MKKIILLAALFMAAISYGQSSIFVLKSKKHEAPPSCVIIGGLDNTVDVNTLTYDLLDTETFKYFAIMAKINDANLIQNTVTTIDDIIKYASGSGDLVVVSAETKTTAFPTAAGCSNGAITGAKEFRVVLEYTPTSYVAGTSISTVFDLVGGDQLTFNLNVTAAPLSVEKLQKFNFSYAPNPTSDIINVSAVKNISKVEIFNLLGQKTKSININSSRKAINISELPTGIYIMQVTIEEAIGTYKIIKQ